MDVKREIVREFLEKKGFYLNDGIKYGLDFLVYTDTPNKVHSKYGLLVVEDINFQLLVAYQRICNANNKILILATINEQEEVQFHSCTRFELNIPRKNVLVDPVEVKSKKAKTLKD